MTVRPVREALLQELAALPDSQIANVLDYVRFLRMQSVTDAEISEQFTAALVAARAAAANAGITEDDIQSEIDKVRAKR